jgi:hypothetical protein
MSALYIRADEAYSRDGTVTTTAGTTDTAYTDDWLVDGRANRPAKATNGTVTWSIASTAGECGGVAICNHNLTVNATLGGDISATWTVPSARANGIPLNGWKQITPVSGVDLVTVAISANTADVVIGEVVYGKVRTVPRGAPMLNGQSSAQILRGQFSGGLSVNKYDNGEAQRVWRSTVAATTAEADDLVAWFESQRNESKYSLFVPDSTVNDAWLGFLSAPDVSYLAPGYYRVTLNFTEIPRVRW